MKKILVSIYVIRINEWFDVFLPINISTSDALELIQKVIVEYSNNNYLINNNSLLFNCENGMIINLNNSIKFSGLKNGCRVILY